MVQFLRSLAMDFKVEALDTFGLGGSVGPTEEGEGSPPPAPWPVVPLCSTSASESVSLPMVSKARPKTFSINAAHA